MSNPLEDSTVMDTLDIVDLDIHIMECHMSIIAKISHLDDFMAKLSKS